MALYFLQSVRQEPGRSCVVGFKEVEQDVGVFLPPCRLGWMDSIGSHILAGPDQTITAAKQAIRPLVRPPRHPRRHYVSVIRIVIQRWSAVELILNYPLHGEARLVSVRFRVSGVLESIVVAVIELAGVIR